MMHHFRLHESGYNKNEPSRPLINMIPDYKRVQQATYFNPLINMIPENRFVPCLPYYNMVFKLTDNGMSFLLLKELSFISYLVPTYF